jgi:DNA-binding response OmpR family regulator
MSGFSDDHHSQLNNYQLYEDRLVKPFNFEDLLKRIKHLLQK